MAQISTDTLQFRFPRRSQGKPTVESLQQEIEDMKRAFEQWIGLTLRPMLSPGGTLKPANIYHPNNIQTFINFPVTGGIVITSHGNPIVNSP